MQFVGRYWKILLLGFWCRARFTVESILPLYILIKKSWHYHCLRLSIASVVRITLRMTASTQVREIQVERCNYQREFLVSLQATHDSQIHHEQETEKLYTKDHDNNLPNQPITNAKPTPAKVPQRLDGTQFYLHQQARRR